jgi:hypothetical protein
MRRMIVALGLVSLVAVLSGPAVSASSTGQSVQLGSASWTLTCHPDPFSGGPCPYDMSKDTIGPFVFNGLFTGGGSSFSGQVTTSVSGLPTLVLPVDDEVWSPITISSTTPGGLGGTCNILDRQAEGGVGLHLLALPVFFLEFDCNVIINGAAAIPLSWQVMSEPTTPAALVDEVIGLAGLVAPLPVSLSYPLVTQWAGVFAGDGSPLAVVN